MSAETVSFEPISSIAEPTDAELAAIEEGIDEFDVVTRAVSATQQTRLNAPVAGPQRRHIENEGQNFDWQEEANCLGVDPDLFFPERGASTREAKEVCRGCTARLDCLEYALASGEKFGIWGGLSERERRRLRRQRAQAGRRSAQ